MRTLLLAAFGVLAAVAAALLLAETPPLEADPHAPLRDQARCPTCHEVTGGEVEPDAFVAPVLELCTACHGLDRLGRSHPYGVEPARSRLKIEPPQDFPLEDGRISCGTCHRPHAEWASREPCFSRQEPVLVGGVRWYRTYLLRVPARPGAGFTPLCQSCHRDR